MMTKRDLAGKAGEYRVLSELLLRGIYASPFIVEDGGDLFLNNGKIIQVRSRQAYKTNTHVGGFQIVLINTYRYDYLIVWGWGKDKDYFYIFPKEALEGIKNVYLNPDKGTPPELHKYLDRWDILKQD